MIDIALRAYQESAVEQLRGGIRRGHRKQVLCAPTGSGKTVVAAWFMQAALRNGKRAAFLCDRIGLVEQTSEAFAEYEIPHGIVQGENTFGRSEPIQICSAQTIEKRGFWPSLNLLVVDECHRQRKATLKFVNEWNGITLGLSATPFARGLADTYSNVVNARTTVELLRDGWLSECRVFEAKRLIDMKGAAKKPGGEWTDSAAEQRGTVIVGDVVSEWIEKTNRVFGRPVKTLFAGPTVAYCEKLCGEFQRAGFDFRMSSYLDRDKDATKELLRGFKAGEFLGLGSVDKFSVGTDVPDILCLIAARPYNKSFTMWMQLLGRLMRIAEGKKYGLVLDFTGNYLAWYRDMVQFFQEGCTDLKSAKKDRDRKREARKPYEPVCKRCGFVMKVSVTRCPSCGLERRTPRPRVETAAGRMEETQGITAKAGEWKRPENREATWVHICRVASHRNPGDAEKARKFAYAQFKGLFPDANWPKSGFHMDFGTPDEAVRKAIMHRLIRYWKGKGKKRDETLARTRSLSRP